MRKLLVVVVMVAACGGKKDKDKDRPQAQDPAAAAAKDGGGDRPAAKDGGGDKPAAKDGGAAPAAKKEPLVERKQVEALMTAWLEAQNTGDFDAYATLYTEDFKGVRRSGKQTVRLDRKGWLADRKKMFKRPMLVAARDVEIVLGNGRATAKFVQEWSSGKYHDVGPKVIEVTADGALLRIAREELLASKIVKTPKPGPVAIDAAYPIYPVWEGRVLLTAELGTLEGASARLIDGSIPERDPECDDDPPDYEEDQDRFWGCEASDPERGFDTFTATASVDRAALPRPIAAWIGQEVRISGGAGGPCTATVEQIELYAEAEVTYSSVTGSGDDDASVAEAVLAGGASLVAKLTGSCQGTWAQLASAPAGAEWAVAEAAPDVAKAVLAKVKDDLGFDDYDLEDIDVDVFTSPDGKTRFAYAARDEEECYGLAGVTILYPLQGAQVGDALIDDPDLVLRDLVDTNGDGWPELVFIDGVATYAADTETYDYVRLFQPTDEIAAECGE